MAFDVQAALDEGYSQEEIDAFLAQENQQPTEEITTEEIVVTPEPPQPKPTTGFDVEAARAGGVSEEDIQAILSQEKYDKKYRNYCAMQAGDAKSDFAAKKMYETCLDQYGVSK